MEFETFGYCYVLVFGMEMELVTVINFLLLLSGLVFHYCNISTYYFPWISECANFAYYQIEHIETKLTAMTTYELITT